MTRIRLLRAASDVLWHASSWLDMWSQRCVRRSNRIALRLVDDPARNGGDAQ